MNKKSWIYIILIVLAISIYYYQTGPDAVDYDPSLSASEAPTYQSNDMLTVVYDPSGDLLYKIVATKVQYFENTGETHFENPNVTLYDKEKSASWNAKSNTAILTKNRILYLYEQVEFNNLTPNAQLERISMDNAKVNLITQIITSEDEVKIQGPGFYSTGDKLRGNLREKTANLLENVKTYYGGQLTTEE
ncbi:LPS export ABC transporter periplasmic protein LptC [Zophobihabitans entericus]|uniref:Lipopolysaccharide export system protein LptC n=1 Tax=Zophobihabitans entericus TaxID=1635327 RepID=A0A6G9IF45_9GAMM|nr:LPS export ABC transporter periplasmic protein LptC [Zophobihabitans entericus]QIQ22324.1 LPS export ABC transporter periplasmic protein LptC [Zophobihabitans entericus]